MIVFPVGLRVSSLSLRHVFTSRDNADRVLGATAFIGLGAYSYFSGTQQLQKQQTAILKSKSRFGMKSRQAGIVGIAAAFVGMGFWRLVN